MGQPKDKEAKDGYFAEDMLPKILWILSFSILFIGLIVVLIMDLMKIK